ncbi:MAG: hypothetical protein MUE56_06990 [Ignavibacteria bacterium]|nr:hypothetical protein [Ignavibacteria bacterium]
MNKKTYTLILLFLAALLAGTDISFSQTAGGQDTALLRANKRLPILNGFRFMHSDIVKDPFINTYLKVGVGSATAVGMDSYVKNFQGAIVDTVSGDLNYVAGNLEFQYAVNNWLSFKGSYTGYGRIGKNTYTILTSGVSYTTGYTLGGKANFYNSKKTSMSGGLEFSSTEVYMYNVYDYIKRIIANPGDSTLRDDLLEKDNIYKLSADYNIAYAPANWFGILGIAGLGITKPFQQKERGNLKIGANASVDFLNVRGINFPIGLAGSARYSVMSETGEDASNVLTFAFRIGYTGHKDFDIGLEAGYQKLNFRKKDEPVKTVIYDAKLRYYF